MRFGTGAETKLHSLDSEDKANVRSKDRLLFSFPIVSALLVSVLTIAFPQHSSAQYLSNGTGSAVVGAFGMVFTHESGHAIAGLLLGREIETFRPYPSKIKWELENGETTELWNLGFVQIKHDGEGPIWKGDRDHALVSAMGTGATSASVLLLSPLLPNVSGFGAQSLDDMLFFNTFDWPSYVVVDSLGLTKGTGDWNQVSRATKVPMCVWLGASIATSLLLNQYRLYWRKKAPEGSPLKQPDAALAMQFSF